MRFVADNPDLALVLLDLGLPDRDGFDVLAELRERYPTIPVVVLSGHHDRANVVRALDLGALGVHSENRSAAGTGERDQFGTFRRDLYPPEILARPEAAASGQPGLRRRAANISPTSPRDLGLTERQVEVLALMMQGKSNKAIGRTLDLAEPTVRNHVTAVLKALNVTNRTEAVIAVVRLGWDLPPTS